MEVASCKQEGLSLFEAVYFSSGNLFFLTHYSPRCLVFQICQFCGSLIPELDELFRAYVSLETH